MKPITLEIYIEGSWIELGSFEPTGTLQQGFECPGFFSYADSYLHENFDHLNEIGFRALSLNSPINYGIKTCKSWHPYLLDIMPNGAARKSWAKRLGIVEDGQPHDFEILTKAGHTPPGNIRVKTNNRKSKTTEHPGFTEQDITDRGLNFIDYAEKMGAIVSGFSGAGGMAPKFLLVKKNDASWHGDSCVNDELIDSHFVIKYPRGNTKRDKQILEVEADYLRLAKDIGLNVYGKIYHKNNTLFIERFDRTKNHTHKNVEYHGLESLCSAMGISSYAKSIKNEEALSTIKKYSDSFEADIFEYIKRDLLNLMCGNTDNHSRNTSFLKTTNGKICLSPLYDFAPMAYDPEIIPRATKWETEHTYIPNLLDIENYIKELGIQPKLLKENLKSFLDATKTKKELLYDESPHHDLLNHCTKYWGEIQKLIANYLEEK